MLHRLNTLVAEAYARIATRDLRREEGQALTEYALVLGVIVVAVITALATIGTNVKGKISAVCQALTGGTAGC